MSHRKLLSCLVLVTMAAVPLALSGASASTASSRLTVAQIVDKNVAARGGLAAWRAVHTMTMSGKLQAGGTNNVELRFELDLARARKSRLELQFRGQTAVQVYDGVNGWKVRPFLNRHEVEPYSPEELKQASSQSDLDGLLIDYAAKGERIELADMDKVADQDAYKLKVTMNNGQSKYVWVDAKSFLETKIEDSPRRLDGKEHAVYTYMQDYRSVKGLMVPYLLETAVDGVKRSEKIRVESVVINPKLDASRFVKPTP